MPQCFCGWSRRWRALGCQLCSPVIRWIPGIKTNAIRIYLYTQSKTLQHRVERDGESKCQGLQKVHFVGSLIQVFADNRPEFGEVRGQSLELAPPTRVSAYQDKKRNALNSQPAHSYQPSFWWRSWHSLVWHKWTAWHHHGCQDGPTPGSVCVHWQGKNCSKVQ